MIKILKICFVSLFLINAHQAYAEDTCEDFNTHNFFENIDFERLDYCAAINDGALNLKKDSNNSIPIFKALGSDEISPSDLNNLFSALNENQRNEIFSITDNSGDDLLHLAIKNSNTIEHLMIALSWGANPSQFTFGGNPNIIDKLGRQNDEYSTLLLSALKIGGATVSKNLPLSFSDSLALMQADRWKDVSLSGVEIIEKGRVHNNENYDNEICLTIIDPETARELSGETMASCVDYPLHEYFDENGSSFLHILAKESQDPTVIDFFLGTLDEERRLLLLNTKDKDGLKPIHVAAKYNMNASFLIRLVAWGADPNEVVERKVRLTEIKTREWKERPIHFIAARTDDMGYSMMLTLLALGADPIAQDPVGNTPLHIVLASEKAYVPTLTLLLYAQTKQQSWISSRLGQSVKEPKNNKGATPLLYAVTKKLGDKEDAYSDESIRDFYIILEMLDFGANPDETDQDGWSPVLLYAVQGNDADTFRTLLDYSENACNISTKNGFTVLAALKENNHLATQPVYDGQFDTSVLGLFQKKCAF